MMVMVKVMLTMLWLLLLLVIASADDDADGDSDDEDELGHASVGGDVDGGGDRDGHAQQPRSPSAIPCLPVACQVFLPGSACDTVVAVIVVGSSSMALPGYFVARRL